MFISEYLANFINKYKQRYIKTIVDKIFGDKETNIYDRLKFISVTASENNPSDNINKYILRSFALYVLSPIMIFFGAFIVIISVMYSMIVIAPLSAIFILTGIFELFLL